jgi:hypothetical protein
VEALLSKVSGGTQTDSTVSQVHEGLRKMPGEGKCEGRVWVDSAAEGTLRTF